MTEVSNLSWTSKWCWNTDRLLPFDHFATYPKASLSPCTAYFMAQIRFSEQEYNLSHQNTCQFHYLLPRESWQASSRVKSVSKDSACLICETTTGKERPRGMCSNLEQRHFLCRHIETCCRATQYGNTRIKPWSWQSQGVKQIYATVSKGAAFFLSCFEKQHAGLRSILRHRHLQQRQK